MPDSGAFDWSSLAALLDYARLARVLALLLVGGPAILLLSRLLARMVARRFSPQSAMLVRKAVFYACLAMLVVMVLRELDFKLTALLGAVGIAGIAIGFASQTSVSNIISGLFLVSEKPFAVGDFIEVEGTKGAVLSIDLLSVKIRTLDNRYVRIPNENLLKTPLVNLTRFPIRRIDVTVGVAYKEDVARVKAILKDLATKNPYCLDEPEPVILFSNFGDSALEFLFGVWCVRTDFLKLKNAIMQDIKERFDAEGIEIPFPHRTFYTGAATDPLPIRLVNNRAPASDTDSTDEGRPPT